MSAVPVPCELGTLNFNQMWIANQTYENFIEKYELSAPFWDCSLAEPQNGRNVIMGAALYSNCELLSSIITERKVSAAVLNLGCFNDGLTALEYTQIAIQAGISAAQRTNAISCLKILLLAGADPELISPACDPLLWAEERKNHEIAELYMIHGVSRNPEGSFLKEVRLQLSKKIYLFFLACKRGESVCSTIPSELGSTICQKLVAMIREEKLEQDREANNGGENRNSG